MAEGRRLNAGAVEARMRANVINRRGSFLYARAYRGLAIGLTVIYLLVGGAIALIAAIRFESILVGMALFAFVVVVVVSAWCLYLVVLWVFNRESRQSVELTSEGVREVRDGLEHAFIPWAGVKEIELAATLVAGASLRVKGSFSEIAVSNIDLMIDKQMTLAEMHRALGKTTRMRELLDDVRAAAPQATLRLNRLARRRTKKFEWARSA
jgi:hypothetical protein